MTKSKLGAIILTSLSLAIVTSCGSSEKENSSSAMKKYCEQYASKYEVVDKKGNDALMVSVNAPDFSRIVEIIVKKNDGKEITVKDIEKAVKKHPDYRKEYQFWVEDDEEEEIEEDFLKKVSEELTVEAIKNIEYTEKWSVEE